MVASKQLSLCAGLFIALVASLCFCPLGVDSAAGLYCEDVWPGPSKDNDIVKCMTNVGRISKTAPNYVLPALCILFLVLSLLIFPIIFCCCVCCQCCCACCKEVPVERRAESKSSRQNLLILMVIVIGTGVAILAVMVSGSAEALGGAGDIFDNLNLHVVDYFTNLTYRIEAAVRDPETGNATEPFSNATFSDIRDQIGSLKNTTEGFRDEVTTYSTLISNVGYGVAVFPLFLFSFTVIFSMCNCRRCCPSCCTCIYYLIGIIFALVGFIILILASIFGDVCAEIDLQNARSPGLFQWYAIPTCENTINFTDAKESILEMEAEFAVKFCDELLKRCSNTTTLNANPEDQFYCPVSNETKASDCSTFAKASVIVANSFAKTGSVVCAGASDTNCTFRHCPTDCADPTLRDASKDALKILDSASRLFAALDIVVPLMDCNVIIDRVLRIFDSCPKLRDGLMKMGIAFFLTLVMIVFAWIIMFRGQKVWFSQEEYDEGELRAQEMKVMDGDAQVIGNPIEGKPVSLEESPGKKL